MVFDLRQQGRRKPRPIGDVLQRKTSGLPECLNPFSNSYLFEVFLIVHRSPPFNHLLEHGGRDRTDAAPFSKALMLEGMRGW